MDLLNSYSKSLVHTIDCPMVHHGILPREIRSQAYRLDRFSLYNTVIETTTLVS